MSSHVEISKRLVLINAISSLLTRVTRVGVLLWLHQYLLTRLPEAEYAPYPVVVSFVLFLQLFISMLAGGVGRYVTDAYAKGDREKVTEIVSSMVPIFGTGVVIFGVLGALASWNVDALLKIDPGMVGDAQLMMGLMVAGQACALFMGPFTVGIQVRQKFILLNMIQLGQEVVNVAVLCALLFGVSTSVMWVVVASTVSTVASSFTAVILSRRLVPELRFDPTKINKGIRGELTGFGFWMMIGNLAYRIRSSVDAVILNRFGTAVDVNAFHIGSLPDRQMGQVVSLAAGVLQPALTAMHATNRWEALQDSYLRGNRYYLWIALAVAVPLIVFAEELVLLYVGDRYISAAMVAVILYASYPAQYATEMLYRIAVAMARIRQFFTITIAICVTKIVLSIYFVGSLDMGAQGAAMSTLVTVSFFHMFMMWPLGLRMLELPLRRYVWETLIPGLVPAVVAIGACLGLQIALPPDSWPRLLLELPLGMLVYVGTMFLCFRPEDRADLKSALSGFRRILSSD